MVSIMFFEILTIFVIGCVLVYYSYKGGLKRGAERAIDELESGGFIAIDKITGDINPVHWEYIYPDRKGKNKIFRPKKKKRSKKK